MEKSMKEGNNKSFWKYIKSRRKDNIGVAGIKVNGVLHQDSETKANLLLFAVTSYNIWNDITS